MTKKWILGNDFFPLQFIYIKISTSVYWESSPIWHPQLWWQVMPSQGRQWPGTAAVECAALVDMSDLCPDCRATQLSDCKFNNNTQQKRKKKTLRHSDAFVLMILSTRIYTPLFLCHYIAIQDLQAQAPTHDIWPIVETRQRWGRHNTRVAHDGKLLQLMKWRQVWHLE